MKNAEILKQLLEEKQDLLKKLEATSQAIIAIQTLERLKTPEKLSETVKRKYERKENISKGISYGKAIRQILETRKRVQTKAELYQILADKYEVKITKTAKTKIGQALGNLKINGVINFMDADDKDNRIYGLSEWFSADNQILNEYMRESLTT